MRLNAWAIKLMGLRNDGYDICLEGIKDKFLQNPPLFNMLKSTDNEVVVEATADRLWGTGDQL